MSTDITDRKRAEERLRIANSQLAQAVTQAEELAVRAEAANRAKSEFLANMSHENPHAHERRSSASRSC